MRPASAPGGMPCPLGGDDAIELVSALGLAEAGAAVVAHVTMTVTVGVQEH